MKIGALAAILLLSAGTAAGAEPPIDLKRFEVIQSESGPTNYYTVVRDIQGSWIRARYRPPLKTVLLAYQLEDAQRARAQEIQWRWRVNAFPAGADECVEGKGDSAAAVLLMWKRGLKWYQLSCVWSVSRPKGTSCDKKRSLVVARDTVVLEQGGKLGAWVSERVDLRALFREHFESGNPTADVPDFVGIGISTDGDQMTSESAADYADFALTLAK